MSQNKEWLNPSKMLVDKAVKRWGLAKQRADNTSVVTLMLDPPGPPKTQVRFVYISERFEKKTSNVLLIIRSRLLICY